MKKDLSTLVMVNAADTMKLVSIEELKNTGNTKRSFRFAIGDVIYIPENLQAYKDSFTIGTGKSAREIEYYLLKCEVNGIVRGITSATWRKDASGIEDMVQKYHNQCHIARELSLKNNDAERALFLAGKTLKVVGMIEDARTYKFLEGHRVTYKPDDPSTYDTAMWPIFEEVVE